jgi:hypothetical protein
MNNWAYVQCTTVVAQAHFSFFVALLNDNIYGRCLVAVMKQSCFHSSAWVGQNSECWFYWSTLVVLQSRFAEALLKELSGIDFPSERIYGLGTGLVGHLFPSLPIKGFHYWIYELIMPQSKGKGSPAAAANATAPRPNISVSPHSHFNPFAPYAASNVVVGSS